MPLITRAAIEAARPAASPYSAAEFAANLDLLFPGVDPIDVNALLTAWEGQAAAVPPYAYRAYTAQIACIISNTLGQAIHAGGAFWNPVAKLQAVLALFP